MDQCWIQDLVLGATAEHRGQTGRISRPEWPRAGVCFLGRGIEPPPHQLGGLKERYKLRSGVWGGTPAAQGFSCIISTGMSFPDTFDDPLSFHLAFLGAMVPSVSANDMNSRYRRINRIGDQQTAATVKDGECSEKN